LEIHVEIHVGVLLLRTVRQIGAETLNPNFLDNLAFIYSVSFDIFLYCIWIFFFCWNFMNLLKSFFFLIIFLYLLWIFLYILYMIN
jgi:hypothetical protein